MEEKLSKALSAVLNVIVSPDDLDALLEKVCKSLGSIEGFDRIGIALFDSEQKAFVERAVCERKKEGETQFSTGKNHIPFSEENLLGQAIVHNLPYAITTSEKPPVAEVVMPLNSRENLIGVLSVISGDPRRFEDKVLDKLADYSRALSVAIENRILSSSGDDFTSRDTLTGLYSQRYLRARISSEILRVDRFGGVFSLAIIEIDDFMDFRKKRGYQFADRALREISSNLSLNLREVDVAARYGEKEFAIFLPSVDREHAILAAKRLQNLISQIDFSGDNGEEFSLTISLGISVYPDDSPFKDGLLEAADMALAKAKQSGSSKIKTYEEFAREEGIMTSE